MSAGRNVGDGPPVPGRMTPAIGSGPCGGIGGMAGPAPDDVLLRRGVMRAFNVSDGGPGEATGTVPGTGQAKRGRPPFPAGRAAG